MLMTPRLPCGFSLSKKDMMNYAEKLKDPRWQKKRLEIFNRDNWTCRWCKEREKPLSIHHLIYSNGEPWEQDNKYLITLCEHCHSNDYEFRTNMENILLKSLRERSVSTDQICKLMYAFAHIPQNINVDDFVNGLINYLAGVKNNG